MAKIGEQKIALWKIHREHEHTSIEGSSKTIHYLAMVATKKGGSDGPIDHRAMVAIKGLINRGDWIRTSDLYVPNVALYQAEPRPDRMGKADKDVPLKLDPPPHRSDVIDPPVRSVALQMDRFTNDASSRISYINSGFVT
jgi:hypothetical protein